MHGPRMVWLKSILVLTCFLSSVGHGVHGETLTESQKEERRAEIASKAVQTPVLDIGDPNKREQFPEETPLVCLAFLSCCGRTNLLNHTLSGIIRHMEEDEPSGLRYEIAWVDNGSGEHLTNDIVGTYEIEHALPLPKNMGLAFGMNALISNLCTAPYILLLEEDWLYLDEVVAKQTQERKSAIARSLALLMTHPTALSGTKKIIGVQLRDTPNTIDGTWKKVDLQLPVDSHVDEDGDAPRETIEYGVSCMQLEKEGNVWGSFTNGASLYSRRALIGVGRMFGEPSDYFHDSYVESNYAFRVGIKQYCTAAISMEEKCTRNLLKPGDCNPSIRTSAFQHIGGGRGTRPRKRNEQKYCGDESWMFYGTEYYEQYKELLDAAKTTEPGTQCSATLPSIEEQLEYNKEFMEINAQLNAKHAEKEEEMRKGILKEVAIMRKYKLSELRSFIPTFKDYTDEQISNHIDKLEKSALSPHQLPGYWDKLGNMIKHKEL